MSKQDEQPYMKVTFKYSDKQDSASKEEYNAAIQNWVEMILNKYGQLSIV